MKRFFAAAFVISLLLVSCGPASVVTDIETTVSDVVIEVLPDSTDESALSDSLETEPPETEPEPVDTSTEPIETEQPEPEPSDTEAVEVTPSSDVPPKGVVYITFDDGPWTNSERVVEILDKYGVKATFFLVGDHIRKFPDGARALYEAGHVIACHSVTHEYADIYKSAESISADITAWESIALEVIGEVPDERIYRYPGGSTCSAIKNGAFDALNSAVHELGYRVFDWTFANNDRWDGGRREGQSTEEYLKESVVTSMKLVGAPYILLLHETSLDTVNTLEWTIEYLMSEGYVFDTLDNLEYEYLFRR